MHKDNQIPDSLKKQLKGYEGTLLRAESLLTFCAAFSFMILSFFIGFGSDRLWDTVPAIRILIIVLGVSPFVYYLFRWGQHWIWKRRTVRDLAKQIQKHHRQLGDRLLGAIELADSEHSDEHISEELQLAAIQKVAEQAADFDFKKDVDKKRPIRALAVSVLLFSLVGILFYIVPDAFNNALSRWANPLSSISRFTFTILGIMPEEKIVAASEEFDLKCKIDPASRWKPNSLTYNLDNSEAGTAPFNTKHEAELNFAGISKDSKLNIVAGDTGASIKIKPVQRPSLKVISAEITYPEYIQRPLLTQEVEGGGITLLKGSGFKLKGTVSRELASAVIISPEKADSKNLVVKSANFATGELKVAKTGNLELNWIDKYKLSPSEPYELKITVIEDRAPSVECPGLASFTAILIDESLKVKIRAEDDYGVEMVDAEYYVESTDGKRIRDAEVETISLSAGNPTAVLLNSSFTFSPELMSIPEKSLVVLNGITNDFYPDREPNRSVVHRIYILSHAQHTKLIQDRLDRIMAKLEDLIRREKESLAKSDKINKLNDKELKKQNATDKITDQKMRESSESRELKRMVAEGMKMMKEALRNRKFPDKTLSEWTKMLEQMKNMSDQEMKDLVSSLRNAQSNKQRRKDLQKSMEAQQKMIAKMKKILEKMDDSLKSLTVDNFVNRLRKEGKKENAISGNMKKMMKDIVGLHVDEIPKEFKKQYFEQIATHKSVTKNAREIKAELTAFFARTRIEKYKKVVDAMEASKMEKSLISLAKSLDANHAGASMINSKKLADNFNKWADIIGKSGDKKSGQGGGKGGGEGEIDMEVLLAMLRMIQGEQNVRDKTRALEQKKNEKKQYREKSAKVADEQNDLYRLLEATKQKSKCPKVKKMLTLAGKAMKDAEDMLSKPQTDLETISAETEVIERLSGAFQQSCKNGKSQQGMQMMSMLQQMMMQQSGQGKGKGGNKPGQGGGGFSNDPNNRFSGPDFKRNEGTRTVDKTGGTGAAGKLPEEYKSAIEAFYRKMRVQ